MSLVQLYAFSTLLRSYAQIKQAICWVASVENLAVKVHVTQITSCQYFEHL